MSTEYIYICDHCGSIADIATEPHKEGGDVWACADCESTALWEFTDRAKAMTRANYIAERNHDERMARLDAAIKRAESHE